jgi:plastocyanin
MKIQILLVSILALVVFVSGCVQDSGQDGTPDGGGPPLEGNIIEITSSGFNPNSLAIEVGETVTFVNRDSRTHWPASNNHPTHTIYPEPGGCISSAFDACKGLAQGETFSFTFNIKGTWGFHDHLNPSLTGTITVEE